MKPIHQHSIRYLKLWSETNMSHFEDIVKELEQQPDVDADDLYRCRFTVNFYKEYLEELNTTYPELVPSKWQRQNWNKLIGNAECRMHNAE